MTSPAALLLAALASVLPPGGAPAPVDPYEAALSAARVEADAGRPGAAAGVLEDAVATWPQDFQLQLARAYYLLRAGRYGEAAAGYRAALALSPGSAEAHRGLDDARAGRGAPSQAWLGLYGGGTTWTGNPDRTSLAAGTLALDAQLADRWTIGVLYRGLLAPAAATGGRGRQASLGAVSHEGQLALGHAAPGWSLTLHGAAVSRSTVVSGGAERVLGYQGAGAGLAGTLQLGLDWRLAAAVVAWEDQAVTQVEAGASLRLGRHFSLQAGWRAQRLAGETTGAALAGVAWRGAWSLSLRGEHGVQRRPWDLDGRALYGVPEALRSALRLQASLPLAPRVHAWLGADLERWRPATAAADATATRLAAGLILTL